MDNGCPAADGARGLELYQKMAKESETLLPMKSDWRSFCMGFSQGGAVSLATHREIEEQGLATLPAVVPISIGSARVARRELNQ